MHAAILTLFLIITHPGGQQQEIRVADMPERDCLMAQTAIWREPFPTVATDADGLPIPSVDAYCTGPGFPAPTKP